VDGDNAGAGFRQTASQEAALSPEMPAIAIAQPGVFAAQVESLGHLRIREELKGGLAQAVGAFEPAVGVHVAAELIEIAQESAAAGELLNRNAAGQAEVRRPVIGRRGIAGREA